MNLILNKLVTFRFVSFILYIKTVLNYAINKNCDRTNLDFQLEISKK